MTCVDFRLKQHAFTKRHLLIPDSHLYPKSKVWNENSAVIINYDVSRFIEEYAIALKKVTDLFDDGEKTALFISNCSRSIQSSLL